MEVGFPLEVAEVEVGVPVEVGAGVLLVYAAETAELEAEEAGVVVGVLLVGEGVLEAVEVGVVLEVAAGVAAEVEAGVLVPVDDDEDDAADASAGKVAVRKVQPLYSEVLCGDGSGRCVPHRAGKQSRQRRGLSLTYGSLL